MQGAHNIKSLAAVRHGARQRHPAHTGVADGCHAVRRRRHAVWRLHHAVRRRRAVRRRHAMRVRATNRPAVRRLHHRVHCSELNARIVVVERHGHRPRSEAELVLLSGFSPRHTGSVRRRRAGFFSPPGGSRCFCFCCLGALCGFNHGDGGASTACRGRGLVPQVFGGCGCCFAATNLIVHACEAHVVHKRQKAGSNHCGTAHRAGGTQHKAGGQQVRQGNKAGARMTYRPNQINPFDVSSSIGWVSTTANCKTLAIHLSRHAQQPG